MALGDFNPEGTVQSRLLCEEISKRSDGTCILAFSRGKDVLACWVFLRQFFKTIIPFHWSYISGISFMERSLKYYEDVFQTKIERHLNGETSEGIQRKWYQVRERYAACEALKRRPYELDDSAEVIRKKYNCSKAYMAISMTMNDNIFRRLNLKKLDEHGNLTFDGGVKESRKVFYPCFDWNLDQILEASVKNGLYLPDDYLMENRSLNWVTVKNIEPLMEMFPDDFERIQRVFPLIKAMWSRNQFRRMKIPSNGVLKKTVGEVLREIKLQSIEFDERQKNSSKPKK